MDEHSIDRHLRAVFDELVNAIYLTKQLLWSANTSRRVRLQEMLEFLVDQSHAVDEAEARIDGRAVGMMSPSGHQRENLLGKVDNDPQEAFAVYSTYLNDLSQDIRRRAAEFPGRGEATLLDVVAEGLQRRIAPLRRRDVSQTFVSSAGVGGRQGAPGPVSSRSTSWQPTV